MTKPKERSTKLRKKFYRTPGGETRTRYERPITTAAYCAVCKRRLQGVSSAKELPGSRKRPGRMFAGTLCGGCAETVLKYKARVADKAMELRDVDLEYKSYVEQIL